MRIGVDQYTWRHLDGVHGIALLELVRQHGLDGCQFRDVHEVSPDLDSAEIRDVRAHARAHRLYLEVGMSCPNPHRPGPAALRDGGGELRTGLRRQLESIAEAVVDTRSVRCFVASAGARHRDAVPWPQQLADTADVMRHLVPVLRDLNLKLAVENHAEATTFELVRLVETLGPDVAGINLDTGNLPITLEDPRCALRRAAPYTIAAHLKDGVVVFGEHGLVFNPRPCGEGGLPIAEVLRTLWETVPDLAVSIEDHGGLYDIPIFDDAFLGTLPDLETREFSRVVHLARVCERRVADGTLASPDIVEQTPWPERVFPRLARATRYVREIVAGLAASPRAG